MAEYILYKKAVRGLQKEHQEDECVRRNKAEKKLCSCSCSPGLSLLLIHPSFPFPLSSPIPVLQLQLQVLAGGKPAAEWEWDDVGRSTGLRHSFGEPDRESDAVRWPWPEGGGVGSQAAAPIVFSLFLCSESAGCGCRC